MSKRNNLIRIAGAQYTSIKRACELVARGKAQWSNSECTEIAFKVTGEHISTLKGRVIQRDPVTGNFEWHPKPSAGYSVMQAQHNDQAS